MADEAPPALDEATPAETPVETPTPTQDLTIPTYHMVIWDTPPAYLCLPCNYKDAAFPNLVLHLQTEHNLEPVPTPLAADVQSGGGLKFHMAEEFLMADPTYRTEETQDGTKYLCLLCEQEGSGHWSYNKDLFEMHARQRHNGVLIEAKAATHPDGTEEVSATDEPVPAGPPGSSDHPEEDETHAAESQGATEAGV
jgi:hypothetical protein